MAQVPPDRGPGESGHLADHLMINDAIEEFENETVAMQAQIAALQASTPPRIVGTLASSNEETWPTTGSYGEHYLVGEDGTLIGYQPNNTPPWEYVGNIRGPQGEPGEAGTVVGILDSPTDTPPPGTPAGTLWWVPAEGESPPAPTYVPGFVGSSGSAANAINLSMAYPAGCVAGDVAVLVCAWNTDTNNRFDPSDTGWTEVVAQAKQISTTVQARMFVKVMTGAGAPFTIRKTKIDQTAPSYSRASATMMVFRNVQLTAGLPHAVGYKVMGSTDPNSAPTVTPSANSIVCGVWFSRTDDATATLVVTPPTQWTKATTAGISTEAGTNRIMTQGGYDLDVETGAARPITSGHEWDYNQAVDSTTYAYTIALEQRTA